SFVLPRPDDCRDLICNCANFSRNFGIDKMLDFQNESCWHQSKTRTASLSSIPSLSSSSRASVRHLVVMVGGLSVLRATWSRSRVQSSSTSSRGGLATAGGFADEEDCSPVPLLLCSPVPGDRVSRGSTSDLLRPSIGSLFSLVGSG